MSSFIVSKREFIKAAGLMCGYEGAKRDSHRWFVENCRKEFEHCYALNVISVNEQYGDNCEPEEESYDDVFERYRKEGQRIYEGPALHEGVMSLSELRIKLWCFFRSVLYQIENDACSRAVSEWFFTCTSKLYERELHAVEGWWGEVELDVELKEVKLKAA